MKIVKNFKILVKKNEILKAVQAYHDLSHIDDIDLCFEQIYKLTVDIIEPIGVFEMEAMSKQIHKNVENSILKDCRNIIFCAFSVGNKITLEVDELFHKNMFDEAILMDAISTSILFHMSKQLYNEIYNYTKELNLGLTCRVAPGDGEIDINFQRTIIERFNKEKLQSYSFEMENDYIVKPYKTITYVYGADESIKINREDHNCKRCHNKNCFMRDSEERIRGPFIEEMTLVSGMC